MLDYIKNKFRKAKSPMVPSNIPFAQTPEAIKLQAEIDKVQSQLDEIEEKRRLVNEMEAMKHQVWAWLAKAPDRKFPDRDFDVESTELAVLFYYTRNQEKMLERIKQYLQKYPDRELDGDALEVLTEHEFLSATLEFVNHNGEFVNAEIERWKKQHGASEMTEKQLDLLVQKCFLATLA